MPLKPKSGSKHFRPKDEHLDNTSRQYLKANTVYPVEPLGQHQQADNYAGHSAVYNTVLCFLLGITIGGLTKKLHYEKKKETTFHSIRCGSCKQGLDMQKSDQLLHKVPTSEHIWKLDSGAAIKLNLKQLSEEETPRCNIFHLPWLSEYQQNTRNNSLLRIEPGNGGPQMSYEA